MSSVGGESMIPAMDEGCVDNPYSGITCIKASFKANGTNWGGWYFMNGVLSGTMIAPDLNWGDVPNAGINLSGATKLTFWARGLNGGERVEFFTFGVGRNPDTGAIIMTYPDSSPKVSLGYVTLSNQWTKYTISVSGRDLSYVLGGFGWVSGALQNGNRDITFFLDDIQYDLARLDEPRFLVSYETIPSDNDFDVVLRNVAFTYDNALALIAFLASGENERAKMIADALVYALQHDRYYDDGRIRNAYQGGDLMLPSGWTPRGRENTVRMPGWYNPQTKIWLEDEYQVSTDTGNMAWTMLALLAYYETAGGEQYLEAIIKMGEWVEDNCRDSRGAGGYTAGYFGWEDHEEKLIYKSTEHNIDLYAAFDRLYLITGNDIWKGRADHAKQFVIAMWDSHDEKFWTGTLSDGVTINQDVIPLDIQAWALLSLKDEEPEKYRKALDYAETNLRVGGGFDYNDDLDGIWYEGTAQMATAYWGTGQQSKWQEIVEFLVGKRDVSGGFFAADTDNLTTGFNLPNGEPWLYFHRLHVGATAWAILAEIGERTNPFWMGHVTITMTPTASTISAGRTQQFMAIGTYSDDSTTNLTGSVTWSSSNTAVARINAAGLATGYIVGSTNIISTYSAVSSNITLIVGPAVLDRIYIQPHDPKVVLDSGSTTSLQFTAIASYSDGTTQTVTSSASWASDNTSVATIDPGAGLATTVATGTTTIRAAYGGMTGSSTFTVLPDTITPVVTLTSPTEGQTCNTTLIISGRVDDVHATASVTVNGDTPITLALGGSGNFSQYVSMNTGSNTVLVTATDGSGNTGTSGTITVVADPNKPTVTVNQPEAGIVTNAPSLTVTGMASGNVNIASLILNGVSQTIRLASGSFSQDVTLTEGTNILVINAYPDGHSGESAYLGTSGIRLVTLDTTAPVVTIESPVTAHVVSNPGCDLSGTVNDPYVSMVNMTLNGNLQSIPVFSGIFNQRITLASGINTLSVTATDEAGNTSTASSLMINYDNSKPEINISLPANKSVASAASQNVTGTISDASITAATLLLNGVSQTIPVTASGSCGIFNKNITLASGMNIIEVRASDSATPPNTGTSGNVTVELDNTAPTISIGLSDPAESITITVTSNEPLSHEPAVSVNTTSITMKLSGIDQWRGTYGTAASPIVNGSYIVTASATDRASHTTSRTATFCKEIVTIPENATVTLRTSTARLDISTTANVTNVSVSVIQHSDNPSGIVGHPSSAEKVVGAFIEIVAPPELRDNLEQIYIQVEYDPVQLPAETDESSLKLYLWDISSGTWQAVPGSGVNTTEHYIYGTITHLSIFGGFGTTSPTPAGGGGGGGGGGKPPLGTTYLFDVITRSGMFTENFTAKSDDELCKLTIPRGTISLQANHQPPYKLTIVPSSSPPAISQNVSLISKVYDLGPDGLTFNPPVTLTIKYNPDSLPVGVNINKLVIVYRDTSSYTWVECEGCTVNTTACCVSAKIGHFAEFALLAHTQPSKFIPSDLFISPVEVDIGESVKISMLVSNTGDLSDTCNVTLKIKNVELENVESETRGVTINDGASANVTFSTTEDVAGTYNVTVDAVGTHNADSRSDTFMVRPKPEPIFKVSGLTISPAEVEIGESANISILVRNEGDLSGTSNVTLKINNVELETRGVTLNGGASENVTFFTTEDVAGTYNVTVDVAGTHNVDSRSDTFTVKPKPESPFKVNGLTISPAKVDIGESVNISVLVINEGDQSGTYKVTLKIKNVELDTAESETRDITLDGGVSTNVTFFVTKDVAGTYTIDVNGEIGTFIVKEGTWWEKVSENIHEWWERFIDSTSRWWRRMFEK
jgi:hypothetical protein